ncbi:MAG TPA: formylglycine-generating enzyme family protein [Gammaproteobacteria bacterium]
MSCWTVRSLLVGVLSVAGVDTVAAAMPGRAGGDATIDLEGFSIDRTEVSIGQFRRFAVDNGLTTQAELEGGGYEYLAGWQRRPGWTWATPFGQAADQREPVVHVTWDEARRYCASVGGRLPSFDEWSRAAYLEMRPKPTDGFVRGRQYPYPVGDTPEGMNTSDNRAWPRHAPVGVTRVGVNGLHDMGANVWEWLSDTQGDDALTAGGSWWYGAYKTRREGAQYKPRSFAAVYIGFRCAYD